MDDCYTFFFFTFKVCNKAVLKNKMHGKTKVGYTPFQFLVLSVYKS